MPYNPHAVYLTCSDSHTELVQMNCSFPLAVQQWKKDPLKQFPVLPLKLVLWYKKNSYHNHNNRYEPVYQPVLHSYTFLPQNKVTYRWSSSGSVTVVWGRVELYKRNSICYGLILKNRRHK